jgi:uncharacterized protein YaeQ
VTGHCADDRDDAAVIGHWVDRLRLSEWTVLVSDSAPDEDDMRSMVDIDRNLHRAVIRFDPTLPATQRERQILHELIHVRLAELEDVFRLVVDDDETARTWWHRSEERTIEAIIDAFLPDSPRVDYRGGVGWVSAHG